MAYFIRRNEDNKIVAKPGSLHSYTTNVYKIRFYETYDDALLDACGNESVMDLDELTNF